MPEDRYQSNAAGRELGARLRTAREHANITSAELARRMGWSQAKGSRLETGNRPAHLLDVAQFLTACSVPPAEQTYILDLVEGGTNGCWVRPHEGLLPEAIPSTLHLYQTATGIVCHDPAGIPPVLETAEHADAALRALLVDDATAQEHADARQQHRNLLSGARRPDIAEHVAAYDNMVGLLDKAALSEADSAELIMGLSVVPIPVAPAAKDFSDEMRHAPVPARSGPVQTCFRAILRVLAEADRALALDEISTATDIPHANAHGYLQVLLQDRMVTSMPGRQAPDGTAQPAPCKSYSVTPAGLAFLADSTPDQAEPPPTSDVGSVDNSARTKPIADRSTFYQAGLRDILWVLHRAGGYQTIDEISQASRFWDSEAGPRLAVLRKEKLVAVLTGHHHQHGMVRDSRVKSYTITPAGLAYLRAAPRNESRTASIDTRRADKQLPGEQRRRAARERAKAAHAECPTRSGPGDSA